MVRRAQEGDDDPLGRQLDWWLGPLVFVAAILLIVGLATMIRWIAGLV